jgi:hypothetical protein
MLRYEEIGIWLENRALLDQDGIEVESDEENSNSQKDLPKSVDGM